MNTLYYGDNLKILRDYIKNESVDLIYRDPSFNSTPREHEAAHLTLPHKHTNND